MSKKIIFLGSSVTWGDDGWSMCEYIRETTDYDVKKWAVSGTTLCDVKETSYINRMKGEMENEDSCDLFICQLSTNDAKIGLPLGKTSDSKEKEAFDTKTVAGAIEYIVATAREKWNCPVMFYTGTYFDNEKYQKMVDELIKISKKWNFELIDLWNNAEMRKIDEETYKKYMRDAVHPSRIGYKEWWGPEFIKAIDKTFMLYKAIKADVFK